MYGINWWFPFSEDFLFLYLCLVPKIFSHLHPKKKQSCNGFYISLVCVHILFNNHESTWFTLEIRARLQRKLSGGFKKNDGTSMHIFIGIFGCEDEWTAPNSAITCCWLHLSSVNVHYLPHRPTVEWPLKYAKMKLKTKKKENNLDISLCICAINWKGQTDEWWRTRIP